MREILIKRINTFNFPSPIKYSFLLRNCSCILFDLYFILRASLDVLQFIKSHIREHYKIHWNSQDEFVHMPNCIDIVWRRDIGIDYAITPAAAEDSSV